MKYDKREEQEIERRKKSRDQLRHEIYKDYETNKWNIFKDDEKQCQYDQRPGKGVGVSKHDIVPEEGVAAIECQRPLVIQFIKMC